MKKSLFFTLIFAFVISNFILYADSLDETLESLSGEAAEGYVNPIVSAFGSNLNGGWFHKVPKGKLFGINVEFGLVFMGSMFPDDDDYFSASGDFRLTGEQVETLVNNADFSTVDPLLLNYAQQALIDELTGEDFGVNVAGPTIVGPSDESIIVSVEQKDIVVEFDVPGLGTQSETITIQQQDFDLGVGGLLDEAPLLPLAAPQLSLGTIYGTRAVFRYMPTYPIPDVGDFDYFGFGIQHNPKAWLKIPLPIDICASYFTQSMNLGDYVTANATAFGLNASKTLGFKFLSITPYAGYMFESSNMVFKYSYEPGVVQGQQLDTVNIKFDIDGKNKSRLTLGTTLRLGVFNINADYNIGKYNSFTAGFAIGI
ncbi:MAG: hypothetical protein DRI23_07345 [Candidatus Cloacimonadota bacterium]|nr:MAG: hypothetical protein DRI23_07345 [Candidatus Cloacimonadota bacterium]